MEKHDKKVHRKLYTCEICQFQSIYHNHLVRHLKTIKHLNNVSDSTKNTDLNIHKGNTDNICSDVAIASPSHSKYDKPTIFRFACEHCEFKCEDIEEFDLHKKKHYKREANKCKKCCRNFKTKSQLQRHDKKVHGKLFTCEICPFQSKYHPSLIRHLRNIHHLENVAYSTKVTDLNINHKGKTDNMFVDVSKHSIEMCAVSQFECEICKYICTNSSEFDEHMKKHFSSFKCNLSIMKFKSNEALRNHKLFHTKGNDVGKGFECLKCEKTFSHKKNLWKHMPVHSTEKPFHCELCNYKSKWKSNLNIHVKTHKNDKIQLKEQHTNNLNQEDSKFIKICICNFCEYKTESPSSLKIHVDNKHPIIDNEEYVTTKKLDRHTISYHKDKHNLANIGKKCKTNIYKKAKENNRENIKTKCPNVKVLGTNKSIRRTFENLYKCKFCLYKSIYKNSLTKHMLKYHSKGSDDSTQDIIPPKYKKGIKCIKIENNASKIEFNKKSNISKKFSCSYCEYSTKLGLCDVRKHMKINHGKDGIVFVKNGNAIVKKVNRQTNKMYKNQASGHLNQFVCSVCNYISKKSSDDVYNHMLNIHGNVGDIIIRKVLKKNIKPIKSTSCTTKKENEVNISNDKQENNSESKSKSAYQKVHNCSICSYTSYRKEYLTEHLDSHNKGMGPVIYFKCPECLQCYIRKVHLISHLKIHTGTAFDKSRICPGCNKSFNSERRHAFNHIKKCLS
ncbi:unnamed protein product, partial [Meganyctiphanes norvegica]